jgi:hypothetical protein
MNIPAIRFVAILVLAAQALPAGLPLLCPQLRRSTPDGCGQQMPVQHHGPSVTAATAATSCAQSAFCPTNVTAVPALNSATGISVSESRFTVSSSADFTPTDPQAPLPPPPQA